MRALFFTLAFVSLALFVVQGCSEDHITNNTYGSEPGETGLMGRVVPAEPGIVVAAWQASKVREVTADDSGYYKIIGLESGMYELRVTPPGGPTKTYYNIPVVKGVTRTINIDLEGAALPMLFYDVYPIDDTVGFDPLGEYIALRSREDLDLGSFESSVIISPPVSGEWRPDLHGGIIYDGTQIRSADVDAVSAAGSYYFLPDSQFNPSTVYTIRILPNLRLLSGDEWGDSLRFSFTTDSLRVTCMRVSEQSCGETTIPLRRFDVYMRFNAYVNIDSLNAAASFSPALDGIWYKHEHYYYGTSPNEVLFFYTEPLVIRAEQTYTLTIDGDVGLSGPAGLSTIREWDLVTEPVRVVHILPPMGVEAEIETWVEVEFNTPMNRPTAEAALTVREFDGPVVSGQKMWLDDFKLTIRPDAPLTLGKAYQVEVVTTAESLAGDTMRDEAYSFFRAAY